MRRTAVYLVLGCCWTGAFNHVYLARLGAMFPASAGLRSALAKTLFNQLFVAPLLFVPIFFVTNGAVRGWSAERTRVQLQAEYVSTVLTMWAIWFPSNFVMFALVPVPHQVGPNRPTRRIRHRPSEPRPDRWLCLTAVRGLGWWQVLWMSVCNLGWNVVLSLASNSTAYTIGRPEPHRHDRHGGDGNRPREAG